MRIYKRLIEIAYALEPKYRVGRCFHVAFITKGSKIISIGWNSHKSHPENLRHEGYRFDSGTHAELSAVLKGGKQDYSGYRIFVIRIDRNGKVAMSKPCCGCQSVCRQLNFKTVYYSGKDGELCRLESK